MAKKIATFKHEVELEGESVGPVYVVDPDNPEDVETWTGCCCQRPGRLRKSTATSSPRTSA